MALAAVGVLSCRSTAVETNTAPSAVPGASGVTSATSSSASSAASVTSLPYAFDRGCAGDVGESVAPGEQLDRLGAWCAVGMSVLRSEKVSLEAGVVRRIAIELKKDDCIRVGIVSAEGAVVRVMVKSPGGRELVRGGPSRLPMLVPADGPVCVAGAGGHEIEMEALDAAAGVQVRLWRAEAPAAPESSK